MLLHYPQEANSTFARGRGTWLKQRYALDPNNRILLKHPPSSLACLSCWTISLTWQVVGTTSVAEYFQANNAERAGVYERDLQRTIEISLRNGTVFGFRQKVVLEKN
jgi:hypothetical protein